MCMNKETPYKNFGILLVKLRNKLGIAQQSDPAKMINTTQQTVSRWEMGLARPRENRYRHLQPP